MDHTVAVARAPERRREKQADFRRARLEAHRPPQPLDRRRRLSLVEQEPGEIDLGARIAGVQMRGRLELAARRPRVAELPEGLPECVVDPRVVRGQADGIAQLIQRAGRHAEPRVRNTEVVVRARVARRRRHGSEQCPDGRSVVAVVDQPHRVGHGGPAAPHGNLDGQRDHAARGHCE